MFVVTKYFCRDNNFTATTTGLSRQKFCRDKHTCLSRQAYLFVVTKISLSRQNICRDRIRDTCFVATKMILVAAPANDKREGVEGTAAGGGGGGEGGWGRSGLTGPLG